MILLAIDTSGPSCSAGFYGLDSNASKLVELISDQVAMDRGHAEYLVGQINNLAKSADIKLTNIDRIAVTIGPGSFAGLRVGLAAAKGFALAANADLVGIGNFDVCRHQLAKIDSDLASQATIVLDGRRGEVFYQTANAHTGRVALEDITMEELNMESSDVTIAGPFAGAVGETLNLASEKLHAQPAAPSLTDLAELGSKAEPKNHPASLFYLRDADAKPGAGFKVARQNSELGAGAV